MSTVAPAVSTTRVFAIDLGRFAALAGMMAAHTWNRTADGEQTLIGELVAGRAAALFAVLAGVGVVFVTRRALAEGRRGIAARLLLGRALAIFVIGMTLGLLGTNVYVIIAYYGLLFLAMAPIAGLRSRWLIGIAVVLAVAGPFVNVFVRASLGVTEELGSPTWVDLLDPIALVRGLLITGIYPVITWLVYAIVGMLIGRALIRADTVDRVRRLGLVTALGGLVSVVVGYLVSALVLDVVGGRAALAELYGADGRRIVDELLVDGGTGSPPLRSPYWLATAAPHTGSTPDLLITAGIAAITIGVLLALLPAPGRTLRNVLLPIAGAGAAPLTVYSVHVALTALVPQTATLLSPDGFAPFEFRSSLPLYLANLAVALGIGTVLGLLRIRGPLETAVTAAGSATAGIRRSGNRS
ncbi:heparan-alpha-glucosaminide N-acetyltransferase domain-containing protein [Herbiconiux sp. L3-i23]|uniref:heparan-alpha-glucosaminide N-acetyltransferase domain-containing protein n=1 Tax=Herbiconiux sp. L3-i23 TaxID=2905871 RepID=UPI00206EFC87|nr:heparan-alpha-glucosaminide N-acetyltransferase domain-containing protein [Herbiconiux sp. L3-i23]BDI23998.1 hypothetical protein L3i23_27740 [Herbiconiux sp. L3-i23]